MSTISNEFINNRSNQKISFEGVGSVYRLLKETNPSNAIVFQNFLTQINSYDITAARASLTRVAKALNDPKREYASVDSEVRLAVEEGADLIAQLKDADNDIQKIPSFISKIFPAIKGKFKTLEEAGAALEKEADRQEKMIQNAKPADGFIELFEIASKRVSLGYSMVGGEKEIAFFKGISTHLQTIISSFKEEKPSTIKSTQPLAAIATLASQRTAILTDLCFRPASENFISQLMALKTKEDQTEFYNNIKISIIKQFEKSEYKDISDLKLFIDEEAEKISASIPALLKGVDNKTVSQFLKNTVRNN